MMIVPAYQSYAPAVQAQFHQQHQQQLQQMQQQQQQQQQQYYTQPGTNVIPSTASQMHVTGYHQTTTPSHVTYVSYTGASPQTTTTVSHDAVQTVNSPSVAQYQVATTVQTPHANNSMTYPGN